MPDIITLAKAVAQLRSEGCQIHVSTLYRAGHCGRITLYKAGCRLAVSLSEVRARFGVRRA